MLRTSGLLFLCLVAGFGCSRSTPNAEEVGKGGAVLAPAPAGELLVQRDVESPKSRYTGIVYYPLPYATPPNLKLTSAKREYAILEQNELGFTWTVQPLLEDFKEQYQQEYQKDPAASTLDAKLKMSLATITDNWLKPNLQFEDFSWEAKGVRGNPSAIRKLFEQKGTFAAPRGEQGEVHFPFPYEGPPNVQLTSGDVIVTECTASGFKWKNTDKTFDARSVVWVAKGLRRVDGGK